MRGWAPRAMKRATAAEYVELSVPEFEREVAAGRMPQPFKLGNNEHWSKEAIDQAVARLSGEHAPSWREKSRLYGQIG
jgi:predicted DNA-binding transcriptional regulator AlpA